MKNILLVVTLLLTVYLNAQSLLPKAGEFLSQILVNIGWQGFSSANYKPIFCRKSVKA